MKTLIQVVLVAVVVGGVSGGASYFLKPKPVVVTPAADPTSGEPVATADGAKAEVATADADQESPDLDHDSGHGEESKSLAESHGETAHSSPTEAELSAAIKADHDLPVAVRPVYVPDSDEAGLLITSLRLRTQAAEVAERALADRQAGLKLIFDDLRVEQKQAAKMRQRVLEELTDSKRFVEQTLQTSDGEREALRREHDQSRTTAESALLAAKEEQEKLKQELDTLRTTQEELESLRKQFDALRTAQAEQEATRKQQDAARSTTANGDTSGSPAETSNLKKLTAIYDSKPPENVATVLQLLVKQKRTAAVVALLDGMKERQSAKVLTTIADSDPALAADLTERLKSLKTTAKPAPM